MDDGLLLNFSTAETPVKGKKANLKPKGNWRERRRIQKRERGPTSNTFVSPSNRGSIRSGDHDASVVTSKVHDIERIHGNGNSNGSNDFNGSTGASGLSDDHGSGMIPGSSRVYSVHEREHDSNFKRVIPSTGKRRIHETTEPRKRPGFQTRDAADQDSVMSSLFTSNPERKTPKEARSENVAPGEASNAPLGDASWTGLGVPAPLLRYLEARNIEHPTRIQRAALPQLAGPHNNDAMMVAQTGSGKTLAYLLPILSRLVGQTQHLSRESGIFAVILAPTRELAAQIWTQCDNICQKSCRWLVPGLVVGGEKKKSEKARLRKGVNILIGTPGRMADHFATTQVLELREVRWVILDEGDRLVELGFEETLTRIMERITSQSRLEESPYTELPHNRVTVLCSATMNAATARLKTLALDKPIWVREVDTEYDESGKTTYERDEAEAAPQQLVQRVAVIPAKIRLVALAAALLAGGNSGKRTIVFMSSGDSVEFHAKVFTRETPRLEVFRLHGSLDQAERSATLARFTASTGKAVLLTTDVAARGLDAVVDEVVEYDPPTTIEDHLHRVGRTARAGRAGSALLFLLPSEEAYLSKMREIHAGVDVAGYEPLLAAAFGSVAGSGSTKWQTEATTWQLGVERWLLNSSEDRESARKAWQAWLRAYTTHPASERDIFDFRSLHLGHLAKAFGLREVPSRSGSSSTSTKPKRMTPKEAMLDAARRAMDSQEYNIM